MSQPKHWTALRSAAVTLEIAAALIVIAVGAYGLYLKIVLEPTTDAIYSSHVGSRVFPVIALGAGILIVGVVVGRPGLLGANAYLLGGAAAVITLVVSVAGFVSVRHQLHPSFGSERAALATFAPPAGARNQSISTEVSATRTFTVNWDVPGQVAQVCAAAEKSLSSWADPGTVRRTSEPSPDCSFVARKGTDHVSMYGLFIPKLNEVTLSLVLTRAN